MGAALLCGCEGGGSGPGGLKTVSLTISPVALEARAGDEVSVGATATFEDGSEGDVSRQAQWTSSKPTVAEVVGGVLVARGAGSAQITASLDGVDSNAMAVQVAAAPVLPTAPYMPLTAGNWWEYTGTHVHSSVSAAAEPDITMTLTVSRQAIIGGHVFHELLAKGSEPEEPPAYNYWRHDPEGLVRDDPAGTVPVRFLDASLTVGTSWADPEDPKRVFQISSTTEHAEVPAGEYDGCVLVEETDNYYDPPHRQLVWYKSGVGMVLSRFYVGDELSIEHNLVEAHILDD